MIALVLYVRMHDGRYHGWGDWPPSPARLFQALVAGCGLRGPIKPTEKEAREWLERQKPPHPEVPEDCAVSGKEALEWLERQKPPLIGAPFSRRAKRSVLLYMPNNDTDAIGGDPAKMAKIRTATKVFQPYFFDARVPFVYAWPLAGAPNDEEHARAICALAERLYQFGRGIDMAWSWGEVLKEDALEDLLATYSGCLYRSAAGRGGRSLLCPRPGSLESLTQRHAAFGKRFRYSQQGNSVEAVFRKPPPPRFRAVAYESPPSRQLFEFRAPTPEGGFTAWPLEKASLLAVRLRDAAVQRLKEAKPDQSADIDRALIGRKPDGSNGCPPEDRVRIIPLPSIGHFHADRQIRRVLVEVPGTCPLRADDVFWAFSGLEVIDMATGEIQAALIRKDDDGFLRHFGLEEATAYRLWRTVTPAALPAFAGRRRRQTGLDPARKLAIAAVAVFHALRHAGVRTKVKTMKLQPEPFEFHGSRAESFAEGTRFPESRLWHIEIQFCQAVLGPLLIGDGRFLGLGLMAPVNSQALPPDQYPCGDSEGKGEPVENVPYSEPTAT
jgi:CRISPR-associated protein Csb2